MEVANTLAYYNTATITTKKSFIVQAPVERSKLRFPCFEILLVNDVSIPPTVSVEKLSDNYFGATTFSIITSALTTLSLL
jgi:hypothetical protein